MVCATLLLLGYRRLSRMRCRMTLSRVRAQSVPRHVPCHALCSVPQTTAQPTRWMYHVLQATCSTNQEKLGWNNTSMHQTAVVKVNVWRRVGCMLTFVSGLDHCSAILIRRGNKQASIMFFPHPFKKKRFKRFIKGSKRLIGLTGSECLKSKVQSLK